MIGKLVKNLLEKRVIVLACMFAVITYGLIEYRKLPTDAFPDISPVMVPIFAEAHGMAPEEIERLITFPIESAMNGLPGVTLVKSTSAFGMAVVYVYFEDAIDIYFARQIVSERLTSAVAELPALHEPPTLGPISTGLGEVFMYYLTLDEGRDTEEKDPLTYLREINDWVVKYKLQTIPGVTKILSMGGHVLQYQLKIDPFALNMYDVGLEEVLEAVTNNNRNAGGQFLVLRSEEYLVRGIGLLETRNDLRNIQIKVVNGTPIRLVNVAEVDYGNEIRRGVVTLNGTDEVVVGIVMKLYGENTSEVITRLSQTFPEVQAALPEGVHLVPYYDQSSLVENATGTVKNALMQGAFLVLVVLVLFLGNLRTAFIVALALPVCALIAVVCMGLTDLSANLMSLGGIAIAIGMLGDASIVMVENIFRLQTDENSKDRGRTDLIVQAATEVGRPILFSVAIIIIVFLPLFTLEGVEGKMFSPMAFTISFALVGSLVAALVFSPVLASYLVKPGGGKEFFFLVFLKRAYRRLLAGFMTRVRVVVVSTIAAFVMTLFLLTQLGTEFIPVLEEGAIQLNVTMLPSISLEEATRTINKLQQSINEYDEVEFNIARIGRPEAGSHPHPVNFASIQLQLKPSENWTIYRDKEELIEALNTELSRYPGVQLNFTQPIQNLFDELLSGVRTQLAIKLYGEDLDVLRTKAEEIRGVIESVPGLVDLSTEQSFGQPQVQIIADRDICARYGVSVSEILEIVELAIGGGVIDQMYLGTRRFGIHVRMQEQYRHEPEAIERLLVHTAQGARIPLSMVAEVRELIGPVQVNREKNQRRWIIAANVRGRDMGGVVSDIQNIVREQVELPPGYTLEYGGQFENQQRAMRRLAFIVPLALSLIFFMLYLSLGSVRSALLIYINVPLALIGGVLALFLTGEYLSVPASVGFIALFGIAVQNGLVLVSYINQLRQEGIPVNDAVMQGCLLRLRPVLMTALTTVMGLTPLLLARGMGAEVQRPLAAVVVGGLLTSTLLTLLVLPALYGSFERQRVELRGVE
jgi:cobalt-zinc-cadmium resistance protein CzcA